MLYRYARKFRYVIINYDLVVHDWAPKKKAADNIFSVRDMEFDYIVLDESTAIKNPKAKRSKYIKFLGNRAAFRIALTGTPVLNRPEELFSQMEFVDPTVLGDPRIFESTFIVRDAYGRPKRYRNLHVLRERMTEVMYRKTRADVVDQLPAILSSSVPFDLSPAEVRIYNRARDHTLAKLLEAQSVLGGNFNVLAHYGHSDDPAVEQARGAVMAGMLMLRFICADPHLIGISADKFRRGHGQGSALANEFYLGGVLDGVPKVSTKRQVFMELLQAALDEDPRAKVVAFSTFKDLLNLVQDDTAPFVKSRAVHRRHERPAEERGDASVQDRPQDSVVPQLRRRWLWCRSARGQPSDVDRSAMVGRELRATGVADHPSQLGVGARQPDGAPRPWFDRGADARHDRAEARRRRRLLGRWP